MHVESCESVLKSSWNSLLGSDAKCVHTYVNFQKSSSLHIINLDHQLNQSELLHYRNSGCIFFMLTSEILIHCLLHETEGREFYLMDQTNIF